MILRDRVNLIRSNVSKPARTPILDSEIVERWDDLPASVTYRETEVAQDDGRAPWTERQALTVILEPLPFDLDRRYYGIEWRGKRYVLLASPLIRRRGDRDHHWTMEIWREQA